MVWYTGVDQQRYDAGEKFLPQNRFLLDYTTPTTNVEEEVTTSYGIPNTNAFINSGGGGGGSGPTTVFSPYTAQSPGSFVTNRTNFGNTGYIQGTEPEETYMDKIGGLIKSGIGMAIPGGNFLINMAENQHRNKRLSATDNAFIDMQLANQEQSVHGGNLTNQDRYGYNKVSMFGNYADLVSKHATAALAKPEDKRTDFDNYYLEKQKEQEDINKQIEFNDWANQRYIANKIRAAQKAGVDLGPTGKDVHGGDDPGKIITKKTIQDNKPTGDGPGSWGGHGSVEAYDKSQAETYARAKDRHDWADGGRIGLNYGGNPNEERSHSLAGTHVGENAARADGPDNKDKKKLTISPVIDTKYEPLFGGPFPTGVFGLDALTPFGKLKATANLKNYIMGDDVEPTLDYQGNIGPVNLTGTYSDDIQNINATINKNNWNAGINYDAITGEPTFGINYSKTFKHGGLASIL